MKHCIRLLLLAILLLTLETLARAEQTAATLRLSLPAAVALARRDNPDLALSRHRRESAAVSVESARGRFLPSLQGSAGASQTYLHQSAPGAPDNYHGANAQLSADLNLFNGFADSAGLAASRAQLQSSASDLAREGQTVAFTAASSFVAVLTDRELVRSAEQNLKSQQDLEQQIEAFYQAGVKAVTDLYQQQAATAQAEFSLLDARRNLEVDRLQLLQALGTAPPATVEVLPPNTQALDAALAHLDPAQAYAEALRQRPDLRSQQDQLDAARQQTRAAKAGYLPSLDLQAAGSTSYSSANGSGSVSGQFDDNRAASVGLSLSIPLFDRDQTRTSVAQARIGESDASTTLVKLQQQVGVDVGQALADYGRARQQLATAGRQLSYARQALDASQARYKVGAATWIELSNARAVFFQAQGDEVRARYSVLLQGLNIGYAQGNLDSLLNLLNTKENPS